jgi:hypothetical protein
MKSPVMPLISGLSLAAMCAAGLSHWWSVRQFVATMEAPSPQPAPADPPPVREEVARMPQAAEAPAAAPQLPAVGQQQFYDALIMRMEALQNQNRDLLDQLAETNRDLMKLEFRVDSHSASFRPLPLSEDQPFTSFDGDMGVLPPRAEPVFMSNQD